MYNIFFDSWESLIRVFIITILAYITLIFLLRKAGKRILSKMNAFDFIVTIALGSTLATVILNKNVALADGVLGFLLLILLQYGITWLAIRHKKINQLIKATPALLVYKGHLLHTMMKKERIDESEIYASIRAKGLDTLEKVGAIILETDGTLTVIPEVNELENLVFNGIDKGNAHTF